MAKDSTKIQIMKKIVITLLLSVTVFCTRANNPENTAAATDCHYNYNISYMLGIMPRTIYVNFGYNLQSFSFGKGPQHTKLRSDYAAAFTVGNSYLLHRRPIANMLWFGIDATWCDLNYAFYTPESNAADPLEKNDTDLYKAEIGMQAGAAIILKPLRRLQIHAYFRYCPTFAGAVTDQTFFGNYGSYYVGGCNISSGFIGGGVETRFGGNRYKCLSGGDAERYLFDGRGETRGVRFYITLRF